MSEERFKCVLLQESEQDNRVVRKAAVDTREIIYDKH